MGLVGALTSLSHRAFPNLQAWREVTGLTTGLPSPPVVNPALEVLSPAPSHRQPLPYPSACTVPSVPGVCTGACRLHHFSPGPVGRQPAGTWGPFQGASRRQHSGHFPRTRTTGQLGPLNFLGSVPQGSLVVIPQPPGQALLSTLEPALPAIHTGLLALPACNPVGICLFGLWF